MKFSGIEYTVLKPVPELMDFVESFWMLSNKEETDKPVIILPDGRIDLSFFFNDPNELTLLGLESKPSQGLIASREKMFAISFKPLAVEHLFGDFIPLFPDTFYPVPVDFLGVTISQFEDVRQFSKLLSASLLEKLSIAPDHRKKKLFDLIYASNGAITVKDLAGQVSWSSRQINRYFQDHLGVALKTYCNILRFRASFQHIRDGKLFPEKDFTDQSHFIREIKKYAGVIPKELNKNKDDRFIQFSTLPTK